MKILVTGAAGLIAGYVVNELLRHGHEVIGLDNLSKYGPVRKGFEEDRRYSFYQGDAKDIPLMKELLSDCDHFVAAAAMTGGISYFHEFAYDLLAENERITTASLDSAIYAHHHNRLQKITVLSSSMVFESTTEFPTPEGAQHRSPPPRSTFGFQQLATEKCVQGAWEQYGLPYTIARLFNCVGLWEKRTLRCREFASGNIKLTMSHVIPDLIQKVLRGQDPLHILGSGRQTRHFTYAGDVAVGIRLCLELPAALNEDFNLSTPVGTTVLEVAELVWKKIHGEGRPFRYVNDPGFDFDVQERSPSVDKAAKLLGFKAETNLDTVLDELIPWVAEQIQVGQI
jgi:nucleoside-diphosphate-sugar epimerase